MYNLNNRDLLFGLGLQWLIFCGKPDQSDRSLLGKWIRVHGDEQVLESINMAAKCKAVEPVAYVDKLLNGAPVKEPEIDRRKVLESHLFNFKKLGVPIPTYCEAEMKQLGMI